MFPLIPESLCGEPRVIDPNVENVITALIDILTARFGSVPIELSAEIRFQSDLGKLKSFFKPALTVATLDEFRVATGL